jgi:hypothetical protein
MAEGEIGVTATVGGRNMTLDPVGGEKQEVTIPAWEVDNTLVAGFRQSWVEGEDDASEVELTVGAGVGSKWGTFTYKRKEDGAEVQIVFDSTDLVMALAGLAEKKLAERAAA